MKIKINDMEFSTSSHKPLNRRPEKHDDLRSRLIAGERVEVPYKGNHFSALRQSLARRGLRIKKVAVIITAEPRS